MKISEKQRRFTYLVAMFVIEANKRGYELAGRELQRTKEQQDINIRTGASKTRDSLHLECLAEDFVAYKNGGLLTKTADYKELGELWESLDPENVWGGRFGDRPETIAVEGWDGGHFQFGGKEKVRYYISKK